MEKIENPKLNNNSGSKFIGFIKKRWKPIVLIIVLLVGIGFGTTAFIKSRAKKTSTSTQQRTAQAFKGSIKISITGSGPVESAQTINLTSTVSSTITDILVKDGDSVKKGAVLFKLKSDDAQDKLDSIQSQIDDLNATIQDLVESIDGLNVKASISGYVTGLNLNVGDRVTKNTTLLTITDTSKLKAILQFSSSSFGKVKVGEKATVNIPSLSQSVIGTISYIGNATYTTDSGGEVYDIEIIVPNPGALREGMKVNAEIKTKDGIESSTSEAVLEYLNKQTIKAKSDGEVVEIASRNNEYVRSGSLILRLENDDLSKQKRDYDRQLKSLEQQKIDAEDTLKNYTITSPIDGVITDIAVEKGDEVKAGESLATIFDDKNFVFSVDIDELDIEKIKVGQEVNITLDAISSTEQNPLKGKVSKIALQGNTQSGVTTYPVTISINDNKDIKIGMNANAEIIVNQKENALLIPLEAVQKFGNRYFVFVKGDGTETSQNPFGMPQGNWGNNQNNSSTQNSDTQSNQSNSQSSQNNSNSLQSRIQRYQNRIAQNADGSTSSRWSSSNGQSTQRSSNQSSQTTRQRRMSSLLNSDYYKGAVLTPIEVGINNDTYIEVTSGLSEGDIVILPPLSTGSSTTTTQQTQQGMGFGIMGGFGTPPSGGPQDRQTWQRNQSSGSTNSNRSSSSQSR